MIDRLRLIADDLTGALDTAAGFTARTGPVPVFWPGRMPETLPPTAAIDSGTREQDEAAAARAIGALAPLLAPVPGLLSYFKLDSLLRGNPAREIAAVLAALPFRYCIIAPAFPFQHRIMRAGLQYVLAAGDAARTGPDLRAALAAAGIAVSLARPGDAVPEGASLWDAETDADLRRLASAGHALAAPVLWCGSAGLATALAGSPPPPTAPPVLPLLGLFGSNHPVTSAQLHACGTHHLSLPDGSAESAATVRERLAATGVVLVSFHLRPGLARPNAAARIAHEMAALLENIPRPSSLLVAGGETLRALCGALGTTHLEVAGQLMPGVPCSLLRGGRWEALPVVSKSGAFGTRDFLRDRIAAIAPPC